MGDTSLRYLLFGEDISASRVLHGVGNAATAASAKLSGTFNKLSNQLGGDVGAALSAFSTQLDFIANNSDHVGKRIGTMGALSLGTGIAMVQAGANETQSTDQLRQAIEDTGNSYDDYEARIESTIKTQEGFGNTAEDTKRAIQNLTQAYHDPTKALDAMGLAADLAAAKHISLVDASEQLARTIGGSTRLFKQFGIHITKADDAEKELIKATAAHQVAVKNLGKAQQQLSDLEAKDHAKKRLSIADRIALRNAEQKVADAQAQVRAKTVDLQNAQAAAAIAAKKHVSALDQLSSRIKGQASASVASLGGKLDVLKTKFLDNAAEVSQKYGPGIVALGTILEGLGLIMETARGKTIALKVAQIASAAATKVAAAAQWILNAALTANPIGLVIVAVAALTAAIIYAYQHSERFRNVCQAAFNGVSAAARWMWNNAIAPVARFIITAFASMASAVASFLHVLAHIPGFGWAEEAARFMDNASQAAYRLANSIQAIPDHTATVTINYRLAGAVAAAQAANVHATYSAGFASGGSHLDAGWAWVGERGPELMWVPAGSTILNNQRSISRASSGGDSSGGSDRPISVQFFLDGRMIQQSLFRLRKQNGGKLQLQDV